MATARRRAATDAANRKLARPETVATHDASIAAKAVAQQHLLAANRAVTRARALLRTCTRRECAAGEAVRVEAQRARATRERSKAQRPSAAQLRVLVHNAEAAARKGRAAPPVDRRRGRRKRT